MAYTEPQKNSARRAAIEKAVDALTNKRHVSTISRKTIVRDVRKYLLKKGSTYDKQVCEYLDDEEVEKWEDFYQSIVGDKTGQRSQSCFI